VSQKGFQDGLSIRPIAAKTQHTVRSQRHYLAPNGTAVCYQVPSVDLFRLTPIVNGIAISGNTGIRFRLPTLILFETLCSRNVRISVASSLSSSQTDRLPEAQPPGFWAHPLSQASKQGCE